MQPAYHLQPKEEQVETPGQLLSRGGYTGGLSAGQNPTLRLPWEDIWGH